MKKYVVLILKLLVSLGLLWFLYSKVDFANLLEKLKEARLSFLVLALGLMVLNTFVSAFKWQVFLRTDGIRVGLLTLWASYITASFFNLFLPSTIGGDAYRIADIGVRTGESVRNAASILADRITGFLALSIYGAFSVILARSYVVNWQNWFYIPSFAAIALLCVGTVALTSPKFLDFCLIFVPFRGVREKIRALAMKIIVSMREYIASPLTMFKTLGLSFLFQLDLILAVWAISRAIGLELPLGVFFIFIPIKTFLEMIPISVFGVGLRDTGYMIFISAMAKSGDYAVLISAAEVILTVVYALIGGVVFVMRSVGGGKVEKGV